MSLLTTVSDASEHVPGKVGVWTKADSVMFHDFTYLAVKDARTEERGQNKFWYRYC